MLQVGCKDLLALQHCAFFAGSVLHSLYIDWWCCTSERSLKASWTSESQGPGPIWTIRTSEVIMCEAHCTPTQPAARRSNPCGPFSFGKGQKGLTELQPLARRAHPIGALVAEGKARRQASALRAFGSGKPLNLPRE